MSSTNNQEAQNQVLKSSAEVKQGRYTRYIPFYGRQNILTSIGLAERKHGRPVFAREITESLRDVSYFTYAGIITPWTLYDLYQNDQVLSDKLLDTFTLDVKRQRSETNPDSEYELFSDRHKRLFSDYYYDNQLILRPKSDTPKLNFDRLRELLLSSDIEKSRQEFQQISSPDKAKFLDGIKDMVGNRVHLASFPRSGNSFLRKILEQITGLFTGSDFGLRDDLALQQQGLLGAQIFADNNVWITKSHFPLLANEGAQCTIDLRICIVRNPVDVIPSCASLCHMQSHTVEPDRPWCTFETWDKMVSFWSKLWSDWHAQIRDEAKVTPTLFLTYEQLIVDPIPIMNQLFSFLLKVKSIEGTLIETLIREKMNKGHASSQVYKLKDGAGKLYRQLYQYQERHLNQIKELCRSQLYYFDFVKHSDPQQVYGTQYFTFSEDETTEEDKKSFAGYKAWNKDVLENGIQNPQTQQLNHNMGLCSQARFILSLHSHVKDEIFGPKLSK